MTRTGAIFKQLKTTTITGAGRKKRKKPVKKRKTKPKKKTNKKKASRGVRKRRKINDGFS